MDQGQRGDLISDVYYSAVHTINAVTNTVHIINTIAPIQGHPVHNTQWPMLRAHQLLQVTLN